MCLTDIWPLAHSESNPAQPGLAHRNVDIRQQIRNLPTPRLFQRLYDARMPPVGDVCREDVGQDTDVEHHIFVGVMDGLAKVKDGDDGGRGLGTKERGKV